MHFCNFLKPFSNFRKFLEIFQPFVFFALKRENLELRFSNMFHGMKKQYTSNFPKIIL